MEMWHPPSTVARLARSLAGFARAHAGSIAIIVAGGFFALSAVFSLSLDIGILYTTKRELQAAADMSALKAVTDPDKAAALVSDVLDANGVSAGLSGAPGLAWGRFPPAGYTMDDVASLAIEDRFELASENANALRVTISQTPRLYLINLFRNKSVQVSAQAVAANKPLTQLTIRSYLLAFDSDKATAFNGLLSSLLGTSVSLTALGYGGLADSNIRTIGFLDALATETGVTAGDYDAVLQEDVTFPEIAAAVITAIGEDEDFSGDVDTVTAALQQLSDDLAGASPVNLEDVIALDAEKPQNAAAARLNLLDLLVGSSQAANKEHGQTSEISIPIAGGSVTLSAAVIEPGQSTALGGVGITAETSQIRLFLVIEPTQALSLLGNNIDVRIPLLIEAVKGVATVTDISCPTPLPADGTVAVTATPSIAETSVVDIDPDQIAQVGTPVTQPGEIVDALGFLTVTATAQVNYGGSSSDLSFTAPFDENNFQTVSTTDPIENAAASLFDGLTYDVNILGIPLITESAVTNALQPIVDAVAPGVDALLDDVLEALGIRVGNTDVGVTYLKCSNPLLIL